jgi:trk system potassium uptake protein TrkH
MLTTWNFSRGRKEILAGKRVIPLENLYKAGSVATAAVLIVAVTTWLLLYSQQNVSLSEALVESVSAFSTTGYSIGLTQRLNLFGQLLIAGVMFFGRIGMLTIIVALGQPRVPAAVSYPDEGILLG